MATDDKETKSPAKNRKPMTTEELRAIVSAELNNAEGVNASELANERQKALDYYYGRPLGNERAGRSSVVSTDVRDTVEWILPYLIRIFTSGEQVVQFEPRGAEDVDLADQMTEYVNYVWMHDNPGFMNFLVWFKDALISKNGIIKAWWEEKTGYRKSRFDGLTDQQFQMLVSDDSVEVLGHSEYPMTVDVPSQDPNTGQETFQQQEQTGHDVVIRRAKKQGQCCVEVITPEYFIISRDATSIENARLVGDKVRTTVSELLEEGFDEALVRRCAGSAEDNAASTGEAAARDTVENFGDNDDDSPSDDSTRTVWKSELYLKVDYDRDGIAELRRIVVAGAGNEILEQEEWEGEVPYASLTPVPVPHRMWGFSIVDLISDIQVIKTTILRQYLDNLYLQNNQREQVVDAWIVDPTELLSSVPGQKIRVEQPNAITPIAVPDVGQGALAGLAYIDQIRENRTGVSDKTQGIGANKLHDTASGEQMLMDAARGKIELIARVFAETGVKRAMQLILGLVCQYQQEKRIVRLRSKWVPIDPSMFYDDADVTVSVALGIGDRAQQLQNAMLIFSIQQQAKTFNPNAVSADNFMNTAELALSGMGIKGPERFFNFQALDQPPPQGSDPNAAQAQAKIQAANIMAQAKLASDKYSTDAKAQTDLYQIEAEVAAKERIALINAHTDIATNAHTQATKSHTELAKAAQVNIGGKPG